MSGISDDGVETFKAIVIGKSGVGKSTILIRFLEDKFIRTSATIGIDVQTKDVNYHGIKFRLELWDTAGQERYRTIVKNYFSLSKVACVVFDLTDEDSLDEAKSWFQELTQRCGSDLPKLLLANKCDLLTPADLNQTLQRLNERVEKLKQEYDCEFHVVSGLSGENVEKVFDRMSQLVFEHYLEKKLGGNKMIGSKLTNPVSHQAKKKSCC